MKSFNLEEAKAGKPVQTKNGFKVTILAYDLMRGCPVAAVIHHTEADILTSYSQEGKRMIGCECESDLVMAPVEEFVYLNIYSGFSAVHTTQDHAISERAGNDCIASVKVPYTEGQFDF